MPSLDDVMPFQSRKYSVGFTSVHVEALAEASEVNKSNASSRTRSIGQHFVLMRDGRGRADRRGKAIARSNDDAPRGLRGVVPSESAISARIG